MLFAARLAVLGIISVVKDDHHVHESKGDHQNENEGSNDEGPVGLHRLSLRNYTDTCKRGSCDCLDISVLVGALLSGCHYTDDGDLRGLERVLEYIDACLSKEKVESVNSCPTL